MSQVAIGGSDQTEMTALSVRFFLHHVSQNPDEGEERDEGVIDLTAVVAEALKISHPYLLSDVEPLDREMLADLRDNMSKACGVAWHAQSQSHRDVYDNAAKQLKDEIDVDTNIDLKQRKANMAMKAAAEISAMV